MSTHIVRTADVNTFARISLVLVAFAALFGAIAWTSYSGGGASYTVTTADTAAHVIGGGPPIQAGHAAHLSLAWTCQASAAPSTGAGGLVDAVCLDSDGGVTCSSSSVATQAFSEGLCSAPTVAGATPDGIAISVTAGTSASINWMVTTSTVMAN